MSAECLHFDFFHQTEGGEKSGSVPSANEIGVGEKLLVFLCSCILVLLPLVLLRNKY